MVLLVFYGLGLISVISGEEIVCLRSELVDGYYQDVFFQCTTFHQCCGSVTKRTCCINKGNLLIMLSLLGAVFLLGVIGLIVWKYSRSSNEQREESKTWKIEEDSSETSGPSTTAV